MFESGLGEVISVGRLSIPVWGIALVAGYVVGLIVLRIVLRRQRELRSLVGDRMSTAVLIWMLVWKLSPLIVSPRVVFEQPLYLLYATGGFVGTLAGLAAAILYLAIATRRWWHRSDRSVRLLGMVSFLTVVLLAFAAGAVVPALTSSGGAFASSSGPDSGVSRAGDSSSPAVPRAGEATSRAAPEFTLLNLDGESVSLSSFRGRTVLINFWASWCPPCRAELPLLTRYAEQVDPDRIVVLGVNQTSSETSLVALRDFVHSEGIGYEVLLDGDGSVFLDYGVRGIPATFVVSPEGRLVSRRIGVVTEGWLSRIGGR